MKLKTLKDIEREMFGPTHFFKQIHLQTTRTIMLRLKQEAIEWIKEIEETPEDYYQLPDEEGYKIGFYHPREKTAAIKWIRCFFNITEEEHD